MGVFIELLFGLAGCLVCILPLVIVGIVILLIRGYHCPGCDARNSMGPWKKRVDHEEIEDPERNRTVSVYRKVKDKFCKKCGERVTIDMTNWSLKRPGERVIEGDTCPYCGRQLRGDEIGMDVEKVHPLTDPFRYQKDDSYGYSHWVTTRDWLIRTRFGCPRCGKEVETYRVWEEEVRKD